MPSPRAAAWRRAPEVPPLVIGHRGVRGESAAGAPENTLAAFDLAAEQGAQGVELDVRLTSDGEVVVFHDATLARMTEGRDARAVSALSAAELSEVRLAGVARVPLLDEVLGWARSLGQLVNVELKHDVPSRARLAHRVARVVRERAMRPGQVLFSSFDPALVAAMAVLLPGTPRAWLVEAGRRLTSEAPGWSLFASGVNPERTATRPERVARWKRGGALVCVWTVNEPAEARALAALGVDALITDAPARLANCW